MIDILSIENREELCSSLGVSDDTELYCFYADPANHSRSPEIYNMAFSKLGLKKFYFASRVPEGKLEDAIRKVRRFDIKGLNISMPHKESVLEYLNETDETVDMCRAVNTIVNNKGYLKGYNTDSFGAMKAIKNTGADIKGEKAVLFGLGGAGKAILAGLINEGAAHVSVFVREPDRVDFLDYIESIETRAGELPFELCNLNDNTLMWQRIHESTIMINSTSVGMGDTEGQSFIYDETFLHNKLTVMDIIYEPKETRLLELAKSAKCRKTLNGLSMLWFQADEAFKLYTENNLPKEIQSIFE